MTEDRGDTRLIRIEDEMRVSYLDYAMSVIVSRALPDVRDGLKPVHRRILYSMGEMGPSATSSYRTCSANVGVVIIDGGQDQSGCDTDLLDRGKVERRSRRNGSDNLVALAALLDGCSLALGVIDRFDRDGA